MLEEIGADGVPQVLVFNKLTARAKPPPARGSDSSNCPGVRVQRVFVSARTARAWICCAALITAPAELSQALES